MCVPKCVGARVPRHMYKDQRTTMESVLSFHLYRSSEDWTQITTLLLQAPLPADSHCQSNNMYYNNTVEWFWHTLKDADQWTLWSSMISPETDVFVSLVQGLYLMCSRPRTSHCTDWTSENQLHRNFLAPEFLSYSVHTCFVVHIIPSLLSSFYRVICICLYFSYRDVTIGNFSLLHPT